MKTDNKLKSILKLINTLRVYDDDLSVQIRMRMIEELNNQNKNICLRRIERKYNETNNNN